MPSAPRHSRPRTKRIRISAAASGSHPLATLKNLGEKTATWLEAVGIPDEATLRAAGAEEAYLRLRAAFPRGVTAVVLYALHGALTDTHWNAFPPEVKAQMRAKAEAALEARSAAGIR